MLQQLEELGRHDPNPLDLLPELEVERVLLALALERLCQIDKSSDDHLEVGDGGVGQISALGSPVYHPRTEFLSSSGEIKLLANLAADIVDTVSKIHSIREKTSLTKGEVNWLITTLKRGIELFVTEDQRGAFLQWLRNQIPDLLCSDK